MRKTFYVIIILLPFHFISAQEAIHEENVKTDIEKVTVFLDGAQITRVKNVTLNTGITLIKFENLSPFIRSKSVQVKAKGDATVLSVNHHQNYLDKLDKSDHLIGLEKKLEANKKKVRIEKARIEILGEQIDFLKENRDIGGKNQTLSVSDLRSASDYFGQKLTELKMAQIEQKEGLMELISNQKEIEDQISNLSSSKDYANGEIHVKIETKSAARINFEITYLVNNASWHPSYDIRAKNVNSPIDLVYKANVRQDTKVDWKNVKLRFSSANPSISGIAPSLKTYYLDYYTAPPRYDREINQVSGFVFDSDQQPLPGVNIVVKGTTIGTITNFDGFYSIAVPDGSSMLEFSFIGFNSQILAVNKETINVYLEENAESLEEVVVLGYGKKDNALGRSLSGKASGINIESDDAESIPVVQVENQTSIDFAIDQPYTVRSDNQSFTVDMIRHDLEASFQYFSVPKIENDAFLLAKFTDWQQYNLLEGEANIFFENTFVGKTLLDTRYASDTLEISLGRDKNVQVKRKKITDNSSKRMVGTKKEAMKEWKITVRNNKSERINMLLQDQIPVSRLDEIKVEVVQRSKGELNANSGQVNWNLDLAPGEEKEIDLKYSVKYPKNKTLTVE